MRSPEIETMARGDLEQLQLKRLRQTLDRTYAHSAPITAKFDAAGIKPADLKSLDDLRHFPFTTKQDLRDAYPFGMFTVPREEIVRIHASSGTSGRPTVVGYTQADLDIWAELMARCLVCHGVKPTDVFHNANGYGLFTGGLGFHDGAQKLGATVVPISGGNTQRQISLMADFGAHAFAATPSYALHIAEVAEAEGVDLRAGPLRVGCLGAEPWSEAMRAEIDQRLGIKACDMYGLSEIMGPGVACECHEARNGLHGSEDHFIYETIDPETGAVLPPGAQGELVITTLTKQALPMIRYRTSDMTTLNTDTCICGRSHMRIARVTGRVDDMLIIRGVNVYPSQIEACLIGQPGLAPHYVLEVARDGAMDKITVEVETLPEAAKPRESDVETASAVKHRIKSTIGISCEVKLKQPGDLPRSRGKAVRVRDLRN
jgi:phenylacetate-CoA ligase